MIAERENLANLDDFGYLSKTKISYEFASALVFRWEITYRKTLNSFSIGTGSSIVDKIPSYETRCLKWNENDDGSRTCLAYKASNNLFNYTVIELTSRGLIQDLEFVYRIQHRSGFNNNGSNIIGLGLRLFY